MIVSFFISTAQNLLLNQASFQQRKAPKLRDFQLAEQARLLYAVLRVGLMEGDTDGVAGTLTLMLS